MTEPSPFIKDLRRAAAGVRLAVEQVLAGHAPQATCRGCGAPFFFLVDRGLVATVDEQCPACEPQEGSERGLALAVEDVARAARDRRGLLAFARLVASERRCSLEDAVFYLERTETQNEDLRALLKLARLASTDPEAAWKAAFLAHRAGLAVAAATDPVAAQMARIQATARPDAIRRVVVKIGKKKLHDGPITERTGTVIRDGEKRHGRQLKVTLYRVDGSKEVRRGERETAPEHRFDDDALGGVRAMMVKSGDQAAT